MNKQEQLAADLSDIVCLQGERLKKAREEKSESLEQVAAKMNLPVAYVKAMEKGRMNELPSIVFARGYIRSYAGLLGIDPTPILEELNEHYGPVVNKKSGIKSIATVKRQATMSDPPVRWFSWMLVLIVIGITVWWWQTQYGLQAVQQTSVSQIQNTAEGSASTAEKSTLVSDTVAPESQESDKSDVVDVLEEEEPKYLTEEEIKQVQAELDRTSEASTDNSTQAADSESEEGDAVAASEVVENLSITFNGDCWISIKDANGRLLIASVRSESSPVDLTGALPFTIRIGAVDKVDSVSFAGEKIDIERYSARNIAKFQVPLP